MDTKDAHFQLLLADRIEDDALQPGQKLVYSQIDLMAADSLRDEARRNLRLSEAPNIGIGGELVEQDAPETSLSRKTLRASKVTTKASVERLNLIHGVDAFDLAIDAAESIGARNSLEKMIAHEVAAAHKTSMDLLERCRQQGDPTGLIKSINAAARLMSVVQQGALTLQRLKTGGNQVMTVQHVTVSAGGQAVIGNVRGARPDSSDKEK